MDPRTVGNYRLLKRLGAGGMGQVFFGVSPGGRRVAVKLVHAELMARPEFRSRFRREVVANRLVNGAYIAPVIDADPDASPPWLVTSFVPGPSLQQTVEERGPLPAATVLTLAAGLAEALVSIHATGLIHRDLKPSNVLLAEDGPRVIDFGIAHISEISRITRTGDAIGSPGFMSPEQVNGTEIGPPSDIFSLGAVLTYAATGKVPFGEGPSPVLLYRAVHETADLRGVTDPTLRTLLSRCLTKEPSRRPTPAEILAQTGFTSGRTVLLGTKSWLPAADRVRASEQAFAMAETVTRERQAASQHAGPPPSTAGPESRPTLTRRTALLSGLAVLAAAVPAGIHFGRDAVQGETDKANPSGGTDAADAADSPSRPSAPEPVAAWPLNESSGNLAADTVGRHPGTATGVQWRKGASGAIFDGSTSEITTSGPVLATGPGEEFSVSAWVRLDREPDFFSTAVSQTVGERVAFYLQYSSDEGRWSFADKGGRALSFQKPDFQTWTHLVGVRTNEQLLLYVDGEKQRPGNTSGAKAGTKDDHLIIGRALGGGNPVDWFTGLIRHVQVYDQALTPDEVRGIHRYRG